MSASTLSLSAAKRGREKHLHRYQWCCPQRESYKQSGFLKCEKSALIEWILCKENSKKS